MSERAKGLTRQQMCDRLAMEFGDGWIVNLGIGIPTLCSNFDFGDKEIIFHSENGVIGYGPLAAEGKEDLHLVNAGGQPHDSDLETGTGDITVYIAPDVAINVRASVDMGNGHRITSDFPDIHVSTEGGDWGPKTLTAEGKLNGGGPWLKVHTSTGDICLKKAGH